MAILRSGGERKRKRKRRSQPLPQSKWAVESERESYSSNLLEALRRSSSSSSADPPRSRAVREEADRALAVAARGRTRWSRAIFSSGRALKPRARKPRPTKAARAGARAALSVVERKARVLGRLVPGCRKLPLAALLEEASDYVAALEMQVRAMTAVAEALSAGGGSSGGEHGM